MTGNFLRTLADFVDALDGVRDKVEHERRGEIQIGDVEVFQDGELVGKLVDPAGLGCSYEPAS
jgi:hypothetical protein